MDQSLESVDYEKVYNESRAFDDIKAAVEPQRIQDPRKVQVLD